MAERCDRIAGLEMPQGLAGPGVERNEITLARSGKDDTTGGCEDAR